MRRTVIDRMALLCTLHADGPRTLRTLREAGCGSLEQLAALPAEKVARLLAIPEAAARRLGREAGRLVERLDPGLEQEEVTYPPAAEARGVKPPMRSLRLEDGVPVERPVAPARGARGRLDLKDRALLDRVVERWRERDANDGRAPLLSEAEELEQLRQVEVRAGQVVEAEPGGPAERLRPGDVPGLDAHAGAALERAGITNLEELATCPVDQLVERTGLGFTRARTLQFLAGRRLQEELAARGQEELAARGRPVPAEERLSPSERPAPVVAEEAAAARLAGPRDLEADDGGAAGPFA